MPKDADDRREPAGAAHRSELLEAVALAVSLSQAVTLCIVARRRACKNEQD